MLKRYEEKRDFTKTAEPAPHQELEGAGPLRFVVQLHNARRLHYDVRLELDGVLLSWAVPKGPSYNPDDKHLAVHVEDHPLDYRNFEGSIPKGEYGGGEVVLWDEGVYSPDDKGILSFEDREESQRRMREDLKKGKLSITLRGHKLNGSWTLVKTAKGDDWLMIKHRDGLERTDFDVTSLDRSVRSGRTTADIREGRPGNILRAENIPGAVHAKMPILTSPMAATESKEPFDRKGWAFELKIDGIRVLAHGQEGRVTLISRNGNDITRKFPRLAAELAQLPYRSFILDGEATCYDAEGRPSFGLMIQRFQLADARQIQAMENKLPVEYCIFDLLYLDGWDLTGAKLRDRRALLEQMNPRTTTLRVLDSFPDEGKLLFAHATEIGFEGVVGKSLESKYRPGTRSSEWVKVKKVMTDEFTVVGWLSGQGNRASTFGSLILGERVEGHWRYVGNVGGGFNDQSLDEVTRLLHELPPTPKPFDTKIEGENRAHWVEPRLIAEVRFAERTRDGSLRFPVFLRLRPNWDVGEDVAMPKPAETPNPKLQTILEQLQNPKEEFQIEVEGHRIKVSSASKVLWPAAGPFPALTKRDLLVYLARIGETILPHLRDRPLAFVRFPDGIEGERFFQKHWDHRPDFVDRVRIWSNHVGKATEYLMCNNLPTLLWLGQIAALEIHPWYSRVNPKPDTALPTDFATSEESLDASVLSYPDFMVVDLDPNIGSASKADGGSNTANRPAWEKTAEAALRVKPMLDSIGLKGYLKSSGKTGLHIYIPIERSYDYNTVRLLCETIGRHLLEEASDLFTMEWKLAKRPAKVFWDHNQNVRGKTLVSIYSPRPIPGAPVSFPLTWAELESGVYPSDFRVDNVPDLLATRGDLWDDILSLHQLIGVWTGSS